MTIEAIEMVGVGMIVSDCRVFDATAESPDRFEEFFVFRVPQPPTCKSEHNSPSAAMSWPARICGTSSASDCRAANNSARLIVVHILSLRRGELARLLR